jgi:quercetin dioxygenase-like cupin family protein
MELLRHGEEMEDGGPPLGGAFVGDVAQRPLHVDQEGGPVEVIFVEFAPRAHTHWHRHGAGQVLYLISGRGYVEDEHGEVVALSPGDTVIAEPGVRHWHGAAPTSDEGATYVACSFGDEAWMGAPHVTDCAETAT